MEKQKEDKVLVDKNSFERLQKGVYKYPVVYAYMYVWAECISIFSYSIRDGCR